MIDSKLMTRAADNIRILAASMVEQAKSGHPGGAMGGADFVNVLFSKYLVTDPDNPSWFARDRFFLDPGHMSPMLYSVLHLAGRYTTDDLKAFRSWGSITPGHPELDVEHGVENTSGPNTVNQYFYTGSAVKPTKFDFLDTLLEKGKDYEIVSYSNNVNAGEAKVTIRGIGGCKGTATLVYVINKASMADVKPSVSYNNGKISYVAKFGSKTLVKGVDYTASLATTSKGYKLTLKGIGNFSGTNVVNIVVSGSGKPTTTTVQVYPTTLSKVTAGKKAFTAKWKKVTKGKVTGYRIEYSTDKKFKKNVKSVNVKGASKTSYTVKKLTAKKKYYVRIRTYYTKGKYTYLAQPSAVKAVTAK